MAHDTVRPASPWLLPLALAAAMTMAGRLDLLAAYTLAGDRFQGALLVMLPVGAFLAALPGRLRRHGRPRLRSTWQGCAACFVGGASVTGGAGTIAGALVGCFVIGILNNGMSMMGISADWQQVVKGLVILMADAFDLIPKRKKK